MNIFLLKILVAHLIGDFFLQPNSWVAEKESKKLRSPKFYLHILVHGALLFLIIFDPNYWKEALILMFLHGLIDAAKLSFQTARSSRSWFFIDQFLHLAALFLVAYFAGQFHFDPDFLNTPDFWTRLVAILFLTFPASIVIKVLIAKWTPAGLPGNSAPSLQSAGKYIGIIERLLVFLFASINHWEAIGFLIAAKSIFRFGDLKEGSDLKLTEYILIGTLLSFGLAAVTALGAIELVK